MIYDQKIKEIFIDYMTISKVDTHNISNISKNTQQIKHHKITRFQINKKYGH